MECTQQPAGDSSDNPEATGDATTRPCAMVIFGAASEYAAAAASLACHALASAASDALTPRRKASSAAAAAPPSSAALRAARRSRSRPAARRSVFGIGWSLKDGDGRFTRAS